MMNYSFECWEKTGDGDGRGGGWKRRLAESASPLLEPKDAKIKVSIWSIASSEET